MNKSIEDYFMYIMNGMSKGTLERYECSNAKEMSDEIFAYYEQLKVIRNND